MEKLKLVELANSFVRYFKEFNVKNIPENFIKEYYILTHGNFISIVEFVKWLDINRQSMIENLQKNYKNDNDYFMTTFEDEINCIKLFKKEQLIFKSNQKYIKITQKCFKDICIKSSTAKGVLVRKYYMELDDLFKKFHLNQIEDISEENEVLKNNQKNKKKNIYEKEGIYVWNKIKEKTNHRIGRSLNVYGRINDHNSSNIDKIVPELIIYINYSEQVENLLKFCLEKYSYRGEFYNCDIQIIEQKINNICNFLKKNNNNFIFDKNSIQKLYKKTNKSTIIQVKKNSKKSSKKKFNNK
jgi:hypothetical protein